MILMGAFQQRKFCDSLQQPTLQTLHCSPLEQELPMSSTDFALEQIEFCSQTDRKEKCFSYAWTQFPHK